MMNQNTDFIPFARPSLGREEEDAVIKVIRSGWLTTGNVTREFEKEFAAFTGARHALAVNSATAGLHLSLEALQISPGSRVITTPYTFTASAEIIRYLGAHPVFIDIDPATLNLDPAQVEAYLKKNKEHVTCLLPVHLGGLACSPQELKRIGDEFGIPVVEDAAHAFPLRLKEGFAGTFGATGVFSFYATKTITTGEGGMIITNDDDLAGRMSVMRLHGIDREAWDRHSGKQNRWYYQVIEAGFKYNLTDMAAAIGREQLKKADSFLKKRREIATLYNQGLRDCSFLNLPPAGEEHAWHLYILRLNPGVLSISRDEFIRELAEKGIGTSVHFIPLHIMPYYSRTYGLKPEDYPFALQTYQQSFSLPIYPDLNPEQVSYIIKTIKCIGKKFSRLRLYQGVDA